jgi:hypothetical protein
MKDGLTEDQKFIIKQVEGMVPVCVALPEPDKSRTMMCLAYEYFVLDMEEEAFKLLKQADPLYFGEQLAQDIDDIEGIKQVVDTIAIKLVEIGIVKFVKEK